MLPDVLRVLGGLGLFLLGMLVMSDGLRALAGDRLNRILFRFTRSPTTGAASGAVVTALVQSSSATTVAAVGFVSAGLLSFPQALGILFGANFGTTITGWMVALLGFKLPLGAIMFPALFAGVMLRLFGRLQIRHVGWALAGFALLFLGIAQMQQGMARFEGVITPASLPDDTLGGRLMLVLLGVLVTLVTQSSSAGVAAALTAVHAGAISFPQACALVIGMDVGTTSTTALATIGGSIATRRTGYAHVVYNLLTAAGALALLGPFALLLDRWTDGATTRDPELALVAFHTTFNALGVLAILPFTAAFARLMERLIPERGTRLTQGLDVALLQDASAAVTVSWQTLRELTAAVFGEAVRLLSGAAVSADALVDLEQALIETRRYAERLPASAQESDTQRRRLAMMHCLDHLDRLLDRCAQRSRAVTVASDPHLASLGRELEAALRGEVAALQSGEPAPDDGELERVRAVLKGERRPYRERTIRTVGASLPLDEAIARLDAVRWLHRVGYHAWRIARHLRRAEQPTAAPEAEGDEARAIERDAED